MMNGHRDEHQRSFGPRTFLLRPGVVGGIAAAVLALGWIVDVRGDGLSARDVFVAVMLGVAALAAIGGSAAEVKRVGAVALAWAAASLLSIGALSLGSIGVPLLVAGALTAAAMLGVIGYGAPVRTIRAAAVSLLVAFAVVYAGIVLTR